MVKDSDAERQEKRDVGDVNSCHNEGRWFGDHAVEVEDDCRVDEKVCQIERVVEGQEIFHV